MIVNSIALLAFAIIGVACTGAILYQMSIYAIHAIKHKRLPFSEQELENKYLVERYANEKNAHLVTAAELQKLTSNLYDKLFNK